MHAITRVFLASIWISSPFVAQANIFTDLGTLTGIRGTNSEAWGVNNLGQVVGGGTISTRSYELHPFLWDGSSMVALTISGGQDGIASAINNNGQIAGGIYNYPNNTATIWNKGNPIQLVGGVEASDINNFGQVVGSNTSNHAFLWDSNSMTDLGNLYSGQRSSAYSINNSGQIVGISDLDQTQSVFHATLWSNGSITDLGTLGKSSWAADINDVGQIVGYSALPGDGFTYHATLWNGTSITDLGTLNGGFNSFSEAINNNGQIVGEGDIGYSVHAVLWEGNKTYDLNNFLDSNTRKDGWVLVTARDISDTGWVVGRADNVLTGASDAYLLSINGGPIPVPESSTNAMMIGGLGLLAFTLRRRRHSFHDRTLLCNQSHSL